MKTQIDETISINTEYGPAEIISFTGLADRKEHIAFAFGNWRQTTTPKVRIHSECLTGDVFGSQRCDCGPQLHEAMRLFAKSSGIILYLRQEGRGIGLLNKLKAYRLQDQGFDTYEANRKLGFNADERSFEVAAEMLRALGIASVCLMSNNPKKANGLLQHGIRVSHRIFTETYICEHNKKYLMTKNEFGGHDGLNLFKKGAEK